MLLACTLHQCPHVPFWTEMGCLSTICSYKYDAIERYFRASTFDFFREKKKVDRSWCEWFLIILDHGIMIRWIMSLDLSISVLCWYKKLNYDYTDDSLIYRLQPRQWHAVSIHKLKLINQPPPKKKKHTRPALFPFLDLFFSRALFFIPHLDTRLIRRTNFARTRCRLQ